MTTIPNPTETIALLESRLARAITLLRSLPDKPIGLMDQILQLEAPLNSQCR